MDGFGRSHRTGANWRRHPAFALVALVAVFLQTFVVQTHFHAPAQFHAGYEQQTSANDADQHVTVRGGHQLACALCQTLASGGTATLPGASLALVATRDSAAAIIAIALAPRTQSHSWQSRAPPIFL